MGDVQAARVTQKLRIQFPSNGAISDRWRVARPRARRHPRRHSRRAFHRPRCDHARPAPPPGRLRARPADGDRVRSAQILSGVRAGETIGGPIAMMIENRDWANWQYTMRVDRGAAGRCRRRAARAGDAAAARSRRPRRRRQVRPRRRARHPRARERARDRGARRGRRVARQLLAHAGVAADQPRVRDRQRRSAARHASSRSSARPRSPDDSPVRCVDRRDRAADDRRDRSPRKEAGDTLGGAFEVIATGVPIGLGSYVQWDRKLDGRLAQALMSIPAIKAVGIGLGPEVAARPGSRVHDEIVPDPSGDARHRRQPADEQRRRPRRRRHQRRGRCASRRG